MKVYELTDYLQREGHRCVCFRQENNFHCKWTVGGAILARSMHGDLSTYSTPVKSTHILKKKTVNVSVLIYSDGHLFPGYVFGSS